MFKSYAFFAATNQNHAMVNYAEEFSSEEDSNGSSDENGNIEDSSSDNGSTESPDQRDAEETTASYSSLEDEIAELNSLADNSTKNISETETEQTGSQNCVNSISKIDDNGNNVPSKSTTTSDSDSFAEAEKLSLKLKSSLIVKKGSRFTNISLWENRIFHRPWVIRRTYGCFTQDRIEGNTWRDELQIIGTFRRRVMKRLNDILRMKTEDKVTLFISIAAD